VSGRLLIVTADDFGLTDGVCGGILQAGERGIVTSTSALVNAPAFARNASALRDSGLGVGAHLCLVGEDRPVLSAAEVPSLVDRSGRFDLSWRQFVRRTRAGRVDPSDVRRELTAQLDVLSAAGLQPDHVDTHQHLHLWPAIGRIVMDVACQRGITAIRMTRSEGWAPISAGVRVLAAAAAARADRLGLRYPETFAGLEQAGSLHEDLMVDVVHRLSETAERTAELATHPGMDPDPDRGRYRWGYRWGAELEALCAPRVRAAADAGQFVLGTFADLRPVPEATARDVLASYRGAAIRTRVHTRVRWRTAPLDRVEELLPTDGDILDVGCGHGVFSMYLALRGANRRVHGVDIDEAKVAIARAAMREASLEDRVVVESVGDRWLPSPGSVDAVVVTDVLYLVGERRASELIGSFARALRPGGVVVIKEVDDQPRWKARVSDAQEQVATRAGLTAGATVEFLSPRWIERELRSAGLDVTHVSLGRGYPLPHAVWVAREPVVVE